MDSLTVHYLARALDGRWRGRRVAALAFDRDERAVVMAVDGAPSIRFILATPGGAAETDRVPPDSLHLAGWRVASVSAPEDDRHLVILLERVGKFRGSPARRASVEVSFLPTAYGARLRGEAGESRMGARLPAPGAPRPVLGDGELARAIGAPDRAALLKGRWMSAAVIAWLSAEPALAVDRYRDLCRLPETPPPPVGPLWSPMGGSAIDDRDETPAAVPPDDRRARAIARMERELRGAADAPRRRAAAHALAALGHAPAPARIALADGEVEIAPRPGERASRAADRLHAEASAMERALSMLPARIAAMRASAMSPPRPRATPRARAGAPRVARPFREYRSSGGLDIWVGRGAASNDALTFRESAPDDVWLHARDVAGAHVVLRWSRDEPPPARDLAEAAAIAAWHSRARGSTVAPVDWTRRKHVRKPRGGPPGLVLVDKVKTVNARPSEKLERSLRRTD